MPTQAVTKPHTGFRHEMLLCHGDEDFSAGVVPFVREGLLAGQPVMVAVPGARLELVADALGADAGLVRLVDTAELGRNPARLIPAWHRFLDEYGAQGQPVRGVSEPARAGRPPSELAESRLHDALLNFAVDPDTPLWMRCAYDVVALDPAEVAAAHASHPIVLESGDYRGSTAYTGALHAGAVFAEELAEPPDDVEVVGFDAPGLGRLRRLVADRAAAAGLDRDRTEDLVLAVHEIASNSVRYGGGSGRLRVWREPGALVLEVRDSGRFSDPLAGRRIPVPTKERGRGLWLANALSDLVQVRSGPGGSVVRLVSWL